MNKTVRCGGSYLYFQHSGGRDRPSLCVQGQPGLHSEFQNIWSTEKPYLKKRPKRGWRVAQRLRMPTILLTSKALHDMDAPTYLQTVH